MPKEVSGEDVAAGQDAPTCTSDLFVASDNLRDAESSKCDSMEIQSVPSTALDLSESSSQSQTDSTLTSDAVVSSTSASESTDATFTQ